ncbi:fimbrial protein [Burkholderia seminalis]|uniref:fimbrial protein n=1 Tax=Burkholderia seminalis TaxID=488731 RepID=UPI001905B2B5|nr:fimbrial protein [Burkholderia seminalis]MBJ9965615.1 type 1 fimbrial protein [Burkholderia seminalis]MDN7586828.1 fimbrial protein [Burkholderia seminalis]
MSGFNPPPFDQAAYAVGQIIYKVSGTVVINNARGAAQFTCSGNPPDRQFMSGYGVPSNNIYSTTVPGVGLRISSFAQNTYWPLSTTYLPYEGSINPIWEWNTQFVINLELVKTGPIAAGGVLQGSFAKYTVGSAGGQLLLDFVWDKPVVVQPQAPTCTVQTPTISVPMPTVSTAAFPAIGKTAGESAFDIVLSCSGGMSGTSTNARVTLTDSSAPGTVSDVLSLTPSSAAKGVGFQVLFNGTVLTFGPESGVGGNSWAAGTIQQGQSTFRIPLKVRYVRTGQTITPGAAIGVATFTMSYP